MIFSVSPLVTRDGSFVFQSLFPANNGSLRPEVRCRKNKSPEAGCQVRRERRGDGSRVSAEEVRRKSCLAIRGSSHVSQTSDFRSWAFRFSGAHFCINYQQSPNNSAIIPDNRSKELVRVQGGQSPVHAKVDQRTNPVIQA
jgi:hypothetical protein